MGCDETVLAEVEGGVVGMSAVEDLGFPDKEQGLHVIFVDDAHPIISASVQEIEMLTVRSGSLCDSDSFISRAVHDERGVKGEIHSAFDQSGYELRVVIVLDDGEVPGQGDVAILVVQGILEYLGLEFLKGKGSPCGV